MNKIFKVIWSKARNCYVVVSELAKSHDDGHVRRSRSGCCRKVAILAAFALTTSLAAVPVWAADGNGVWAADSNGNIVIGGGKANAAGSIVIGNSEAIANTSQSVIIGNYAKANGSGQGVIVMGNGAMADSNAAGYTDNGKYIPAGIVLGEYSYSNTRAGKDGYLSDRKGDKPSTAFNDEYWNAVWKATANPMAIGNADTDANGKGEEHNGHGVLTRQITGVAAGTDLTDAVNVAQLQAAIAQFSGGGSGTSGDGVHYYSVLSNEIGSDSNYDNKGAKGQNSLAAGVRASTTENAENAVAIGYGAKAEGKGATVIGQYGEATARYALAFGGQQTDATAEQANNVASGDNSVAFGERTTASGSNSTAFGQGTKATEKRATAFGQQTQATQSNATAFGINTIASGQNATAFGNLTQATEIGATAFGNKNQATGQYATAWGGGDKTVDNGDGTTSKIGTVASGTYATAFGERTVASGESATAFGSDSTAKGNNSLAFGEGSKALGGNSLAGLGGTAAADDSIALGRSAQAGSKDTLAIGNGAEALMGKDIAIGYGAKASGNLTDTSMYNYPAIAIGDSTSVKASESVAIGKSNVIERADGKADLSGANILGHSNTVKASGVTIVGNNNNVTNPDNHDVVILGNLVTKTTDNSVFLGSGSAYTSESESESTKGKSKTYTSDQIGDATLTYAGGTVTSGIVSVGSPDATRRIQNVAPGLLTAASTDAVNGSQLYAVANMVAENTENLKTKGLDFQGNNDVTVHCDLGQKLTIQGKGTKADTNYSGENLKVIGNTDGSLTIKMDKDIKGNSVTVGEKGEPGTPGKDGVDGTIGVNGKDGSAVVINGKDGISVIGKDGKNGVSITGSNGLNGKDGIDGKIAIGTPGKDGQPGKDAVSISGQNGEGHIGLTGPAGKDGKDASADIHVKNGQVGVDGTDGHGGKDGMDRVVYEDHNGVTHEVATMDDGQKYAGDFGDGASVKLNKTVTIKGKVKADAKEDDFVDGNIAVVANKKGEDGELLIKLNKDLTGLNSATYTTSTKNGDVTTTSTTVVDGTGLKIENGPSITNTGIDGGSKKITNVADGEISATSKDAVNGSQLNDVKNLAEQHTTVEAGPSGNVTVTPGTNADGSKKYTVDLAKDVTFGDTAKGDKTVAISGTDGTITAGTGDNKVTVDGSKGQIVAGGNNGVKIGNIENGDSSLTIYDKDSKATGKTDKAGKYVTNLDNKTWKDDGSYVSGRAATEDQLHQVESNVNKQIADVNTKIDKVDKHHTEVTVNGDTAAKADGSYTDGNLQVAQKTGSDGQKIYDLKLSDNLNIGGAGKDGKDGQNGHMGINGADGKSGIGIDGEDGISIKGKDGKDGVTIKGIDGKNGTEGHIGLTGSAGKDGQNASADIHVKNGQVGVDGTDGHGGKDGMDRVVYEDHNHVTHEVATMDDGMKYSGDSGKAAVKLNKNVQVYGGATEYADGNNIGVVASQDGDNAKLQVKLAKDLKGINSIEAKTITTGDTTMDNSGLTVKGDGNHKDITIHQGNVNMGGNKVSGIADGKVSQDSTDAVNGSQLWQRDQAINGLSGSVNKLGNRINRVGAGAAALAALHPLDFDPDDKWDFAAGYGNYRGANAAAVGAYYRPNEDTMFSVGGSFGGGENMVNAGVSIKLGQGNHVSTSRVAMAKEIKDLRQNVANLNAIVNRQSALIDKLTGTNAGMIKDKGNDLFPDVPANHWAYEYVTKLKHAGILTGYPDGNFDGDRMMTRYEFAAIVYRAIMAGAASNPALNQDGTLDKLANEFSSEMKYIRIDTIAKDKNGKPTIERVRVISDAK